MTVLHMKIDIPFRLYLVQFFLEWKMFQTKFVEKIETHVARSVNFFFFENPALYKIMWKNVIERGRPQMTIWRVRFPAWIPKATNTHSEYVILTGFLLQQWLRERDWMLCYTYIACLVIYLCSLFVTELLSRYFLIGFDTCLGQQQSGSCSCSVLWEVFAFCCWLKDLE